MLSIFFATGHGRTAIGCLTNAAVRLAGRSDLCHAFVGDRDITIVPTLGMADVWPTEEFARRYPNLRWVVRVPCDAPVLERAKFGCVRMAVSSLRLSGIAAPTIWTPGGLLRWLSKQGYTPTDARAQSTTPL